MNIINSTKILGRAKLGKYQSFNKYDYCPKKITAFQEVRKVFYEFTSTSNKSLHKDYIKYLTISEIAARTRIGYKIIERMLNGESFPQHSLMSVKLIVSEAIEDIDKYIGLCQK